MPHNFRERLAFSEGVDVSGDVLSRIAEMVPNATNILRAGEADDRNGTDYWIERTHGLPAISIDVKHRSFCPIERWSSDDACIETTSVYSGEKEPWEDILRIRRGWTIDYTKRTDFIVYTWPTLDGGMRFWTVPFLPLCAASREHWRNWAKQYKERPALNQGYLTLSVYPPRAVIIAAIRKYMAGSVEPKQKTPIDQLSAPF
jgi:hypothetical protein